MSLIMISFIKRNYFLSNSYALVYAHHFFRNISSSAMYIFTGAYFLKLGMPLHFVLLFYGLEFGVRGLLCPFGLTFFKKVGLIKAQVVSAFFLVLFFIGISFAEDNLSIGFFSLFLAAISGAIYYPFLDVLEALYIEDDHNRTKQLSMSIVLGAVGRVLGAAGVGFLITYHGFNSVVILVSITLLLSIVPFLLMDDKTKNMKSVKPLEVYQYLTDENFKPFWLPFFGTQLLIIVRAVIVPIFIFTIVGELDSLGYLIALALILEKFLTLMAGHYTDKLGQLKTISFLSYSYPVAMGIFIFFAKTPLTIFFAQSFHQTLNNIYTSAFNSFTHQSVRNNLGNKALLFGAAWQMSLCFGELLVLPLYGLLAYFIGTNVFYVTFIGAALGVWIVKLSLNELDSSHKETSNSNL